MKRQKFESGLERQFLIGLVVSTPFLSSASSVLEKAELGQGLFSLVANWCLRFFQRYGKAPGRTIETIYHDWVEKEDPPEDLRESVHDFLSSLSEEYEVEGDLNVPYLLDRLADHLNLQALERLKEEMDASILAGDMKSPLRAIQTFQPIDLGQEAGVIPLGNKEVWKHAFSQPPEPLIRFLGDAGRFLNKALVRDALIGIQGPEKRGKTWWCIELAVRALMERRRVAFFEVGDLSETQLLMRLGVRLSGHPLRKDQCGVIRVPRRIERELDFDGEDEDEGPRMRVEWKEVRVNVPISMRTCYKATKNFMRACGLSADPPYLMMSVHPNSSITVREISGILSRWRNARGFIPDVIIIDYADILAPEDAYKQGRDQVNDTWKSLRRLSQECRCLVIAPTQADARSYERRTQTITNFSEDKRKMAHVTGMLGLNQTPEEKENGIMRLNWIVLREAEFHPDTCLYVGQCLSLGRAFCCSRL